MRSSEVQKLIEEKNKLKQHLKVTRRNNQWFKDQNQELISLNVTNTENADKLKIKIQVRERAANFSIKGIGTIFNMKVTTN